MDYTAGILIILVAFIGGACLGAAWWYIMFGRKLEKKIKELQKRIVSNGRKV